MTRISQMALAACLALSTFHADAFTTAPHTAVARHVAKSTSFTDALTHNSNSNSNSILSLSTTESDAASSDNAASNLKRLPQSSVELTLQIPPAASSAAYDKVLSAVAKKVSIPGFRKGAKIPPQVIENAWSKQGGKKALRVMAINELCSELIGPALKDEHGLEPIGNPNLVTPAETLAETFVPGEGVWDVVVKCDVWPDIVWKEVEGQEKPYLGLTGSYKRKPFNQERFDMALRDLKERYARLEPYEASDGKELEMGDACVVNMVGYMADAAGGKGEPLPDAASGDNVEVILGGGRYMDGLVEGLVGGKVGEVKTVNVRFPDALKNKDLAGKQAIFDVEIISASKRILPELTDEFANTVRPGLTSESLQDELRKAVDSQDAEEYMGARNEALGAALSKCLDVDVPDTLITNQARDKYALMMTDMRNSGMADEDIKKMISPENFVKYKELSVDGIVRDFKVSMAVDEIARLEGITVPAYQVEEQMQSLKDQATQDGETGDVDNEQTRRKVESTLERRMVYDFLAEHANLDVEYMGEEEFDENLMEKLAQDALEREQADAAKAEAESNSSDSATGKEDEDEVANVVAATDDDDDDDDASTAAASVKEETIEAEIEEVAVEATSEEKDEVEEVANEEEASSISSKDIDASKYEGMSLEEKAYQILVDLGAAPVEIPEPEE